jgi:hypothetical protein
MPRPGKLTERAGAEAQLSCEESGRASARAELRFELIEQPLRVPDVIFADQLARLPEPAVEHGGARRTDSVLIELARHLRTQRPQLALDARAGAELQMHRECDDRNRHGHRDTCQSWRLHASKCSRSARGRTSRAEAKGGPGCDASERVNGLANARGIIALGPCRPALAALSRPWGRR